MFFPNSVKCLMFKKLLKACVWEFLSQFSPVTMVYAQLLLDSSQLSMSVNLSLLRCAVAWFGNQQLNDSTGFTKNCPNKLSVSPSLVTVYLASVVESHVNITSDCKLHWPVMSNVIVQNMLSFPNATGQKQTNKKKQCLLWIAQGKKTLPKFLIWVLFTFNFINGIYLYYQRCLLDDDDTANKGNL